MTRSLPLLAVLAGLCLPLVSAGEPSGQPSGIRGERTEKFGRGEVVLELRATPREISPAADLEVTLTLTHPSRLQVSLPEDFSDRFEGFSFEGQYEGESIESDGVRHRTLHLRARPAPAAERYRIAPFPVRIADASQGARDSWFPTRAVVFETASLLNPDEDVPESVVARLRPVWVAPSARSILRWTGLLLLAAALLLALSRLVQWLRRRITLARMAPRERALLELGALLARDLPGKGQAKLFYVELTRVVRRYIERRYGIRAPEQTTEEFLQEATRHPAFAGDTLPRLRTFLDDADLVKFAGLDATSETIRRSVDSARAYLEGETPMDARHADARQAREDRT